jgi:Protein of unknown function (DUF3987)
MTTHADPEDFFDPENFFDQEDSEQRKKRKKRNNSDAEEDIPLFQLFPQPLSEIAFCGLAGEVVRAIEPHTEAGAAAIMIATLTLFGNAIGRGPHFLAGDLEHATNLFAVIVGGTGDGRKGTAAESPLRIVRAADPSWKERVVSGLGSGEGVIHHVRDMRRERRKAKKADDDRADEDGLVEEVVDAGVQDKRLMVFESELEKVLTVAGRKDSTLSPVLRDAWDRGTLQTLSKHSPERATGVLVSVLAQTTPMVLQRVLDSAEIGNGFMNRFVIVATQRSKLLPRGGNVPMEVHIGLGKRVENALSAARVHTEVGMTDEAWELWEAIYEQLSARSPDLVGVLTARAAPMVRRFAMLYALLDEQGCVAREHLEAALEMWRYVEDSTRWVFGDGFGDPVVDGCLAILRMAGSTGATRTGLYMALGTHVPSARITSALTLLESLKLAVCRKESTGGRPAEYWYAAGYEPKEPPPGSEPGEEPF